MMYANVLLMFLFIYYCDSCHAAFCSEDELAGECFDDKIKPMAYGAVASAFMLGISTILLAVALLCKAKRRHRAKVLVYRQPYKKADSLRGTRDNNGFQSTSQYHVKRPEGRSYELQPTYTVTRNAALPERRRYSNQVPVAVLAEDEKSGSPASSGLLWVPAGDNDDKKFASRGIYQ